MTMFEFLLSLFAVLAAAVLSAGITWAIRPLLLRHALARPNARSSHRVPTPQGAGIAVIVATLAIAGAAIASAGSGAAFPALVFAATIFITRAGAADDIKTIPVMPRLILQGLAVGAVLYAASGDLRIIPACPLW